MRATRRALAGAGVAALLGLGGLAGCGDDGGATGGTTTASIPATTTTSTAATTSAPSTAPTGATSTTSTTLADDETIRRDVTEEVLGMFDATPHASTPRALAALVADAFAGRSDGDGDGARVTVESVSDADPARAVLSVEGLADDSVRGLTVVVTMEADATRSQWSIVGVEQSERCARGRTADRRLCV